MRFPHHWQDTLLDTFGKRRIISVRNPVMLKRMKMQPATKTAAKAASYGKPRPKQMVKVKNAFVPIPPDVEKSSTIVHLLCLKIFAHVFCRWRSQSGSDTSMTFQNLERLVLCM